MSGLLDKPLKINGITLKNRLVMGAVATGNYLGVYGEYTPEGIEYFTLRAKGGFGLIITGAHEADRIVDPYRVLGESPLAAPALFHKTAMTLNERIRAYGAHLFGQITMGFGRNYPELYAPSATPVYSHPDILSPVLSKEQIRIKIEQMLRVAELMVKSGFSGIEVHSIHWGYLLDQFAMSLTNKRNDEYGGSLENRLRVSKEILEGIRRVCGRDFPITMRLGLKSYIRSFDNATLTGENEVGRTLEEGIKICKLLEEFGYDALNVDTGAYDSFYYACPPPYIPRGYMRLLASAAKKAVKIPILVGSRMNCVDAAKQTLEEGAADAVVVSRATLADPNFAAKILTGKLNQVRPCIACNIGCLKRLIDGGSASCAVNPAAGRELTYGISPALRKRKIAVIGAGVAGMEAARVAALRGHDVTLYEKSERLGGHLIPAGSHPFKIEIRQLNSWYRRQISEMNIKLIKNTTMNAEKIREINPDAVILAVGSEPYTPQFEGFSSANVFNCLQAISNPELIKGSVAIIGGGLVGCETALEYCREGKNVVLVEMQSEILSANSIPIPNRQMLIDLLNYYSVLIVKNSMLKSVDKNYITVQNINNGINTQYNVDSVVLATGFRPRPSMLKDLQNMGIETFEIGDGVHGKDICDAVWSAYEIARNI